MSKAPEAFPQSQEAERMLLSQCLRWPAIIPEVIDVIAAADFYRPDRGRLYRFLLELWDSEEVATHLTIFDELAAASIDPDAVGGAFEIVELFGLAPSSTNWHHYAGLIKETAQRRAALVTIDRARVRIADRAEDLDRVVDETIGTIANLITYQKRSDHGTLDDAIMELEIEAEDTKARGRANNLRTGFRDLDDILAIFPGDLVTMMAHTSHGKTAWILNVISHLITGLDRRPVALVSLEMKRDLLARRMISSWAGVDGFKQRLGRLTGDETERWAAGAAHFSGAPMFINHRSGLTINQTTAWVHRVDRHCRAHGHPEGLALVAIDYLQRMGQADPRMSRSDAVGVMSRGAKDMAQRLNVPVIVLAQPNRKSLELQDKRPQIHHLRESGAIEQDSDVVLAGYYHAKTVPDHEREKWENHYEIEVHKQRNGGTGRVNLHFEPRYTRFRDLTVAEYQARQSPAA